MKKLSFYLSTRYVSLKWLSHEPNVTCPSITDLVILLEYIWTESNAVVFLNHIVKSWVSLSLTCGIYAVYSFVFMWWIDMDNIGKPRPKTLLTPSLPFCHHLWHAFFGAWVFFGSTVKTEVKPPTGGYNAYNGGDTPSSICITWYLVFCRPKFRKFSSKNWEKIPSYHHIRKIPFWVIWTYPPRRFLGGYSKNNPFSSISLTLEGSAPWGALPFLAGVHQGLESLHFDLKR